MKKALQNKLNELGYIHYENNMYVKSKYDIVLCFKASKIVDYYISVIKTIRNRNDIQSLKDSVENYDKKLRIMWKDLEALKEYNGEWRKMIYYPERDDVNEYYNTAVSYDFEDYASDYDLNSFIDELERYDIYQDGSEGNYEDNRYWYQEITDDMIRHLEGMKEHIDECIKEIKRIRQNKYDEWRR